MIFSLRKQTSRDYLCFISAGYCASFLADNRLGGVGVRFQKNIFIFEYRMAVSGVTISHFVFNRRTHRISAMKAEAMSDAGNNGDDSRGAALGTALGAAFINRISMQPGAIMWVLMVIALFCLGLPFLARQFKPVS